MSKLASLTDYIRREACTGWETTVRKWSVQLNGLQMVIITAVGIAASTWAANLFVILICLFVCLLLAGASILASNLPQKHIGAYDKRLYRLVKIEDGPDA